MTQLPINAANASLLDESLHDSVALSRFASQGDPAAFRALTQRYQSMVFATCRRVLHSQADAEDAAQETFLKFARAAATIRGNAAAWLHACALGTATDLLRRKTTRQRIERAAVDTSSLSDDQRTWKELEPMLDAALAQLPEEDRDVIVAHFLVGRPQKDLAREAGVAPGTMSRRIDAALNMLAKTLKATSPSLAGAAGLAAALTVGTSSAVASPALTSSLAKVGLLDAAMSGKSVAASGAGLLSAKTLLMGAAALLALVGTASVLAVKVTSHSPATVAMATAAVAAPEPGDGENFTSMPRPTGESSNFTMSTQKLGHKHVDVFELNIQPAKFTFLGGTNEKGERSTIQGDRVTEEDVKPASAGKPGSMRVRVTKFAMFQPSEEPDPTGRVSRLDYTIKDGIMRCKLLIEGEKPPEEELFWRRSATAATTLDPDDPIAGTWIQIPVWWSLRFQKDAIELCGGPERWVMARYKVLSWDETDGYSKVQTICVDNYVDRASIGKRMKLLVRKSEHDTYQIAHWQADSPSVNEWPTFSPKPDEKIRVFTFTKEIR